jgi:predicted nucleotidyltransferase component of viral defense system
MPTNDILTPLQTALLDEFFSTSVGQSFFLTGGTALAAYYLHHRLSKDIDLFTTSDEAFAQVQGAIEYIAPRLDCRVNRRAASPWFQQFFLERDDIRLQVDTVRDADIQFGEHKHFGKVIVDALENIGANKITAIFGRTESKDFVDLYFLFSNNCRPCSSQ